MNKNDRHFAAQRIRAQYIERQPNELDELRRLDAKVKRPANVLAYVLGSIGAVVMGAGMSLVMTDIGQTLGIANAMLPGVVIGVIGMLTAILNYPIYKAHLSARRKKYASEIFVLSDKIINE